MSLKARIKNSGDIIRSKEWNEAMREIENLNIGKLDLSGGAISGPLSIKDQFKVGTKENQLIIDSSKEGLLSLKSGRKTDQLTLGTGNNTSSLTIKENNVGIRTNDPEAELHVIGTLLGAATDLSGNALKIVCGSTQSGNTKWEKNGNHGIYIDINASTFSFQKTPIYIANLHGQSNNWETTGGSSPYHRSPTGFRIYVRYSNGRVINPTQANSFGWHINWIAIGK